MDNEERSEAQVWALDKNGKEIPGSGRRCIPAKRCKSKDIFTGRCIGVEGHKHEWHFCYDSIGRLCRWRDHCEDSFSVASSQTPDGHKSYKRPSEMYEDTYLAHTRWVQIEEDLPE